MNNLIAPELLARNTFNTYEEKLNTYTIERKFEAFDSFFGTGKTHTILANMQDRNLLLGTPRQMLAKEAEGRLDIQNYQVLKETGLHNSFSSSQVTTLESILQANLASYGNEKTLFVLDEFVTAMNQLDSNINDGRRKQVLDTLQFIMDKAGNTVILDANLRDIDCAFILSFTGIRDFQITKNSYVPEKKRPVDWHLSRESLEADFIHRIKKKEHIFLLSDTKKRCDYYEEICYRNNVKALNLNSQTKHKYEDDFTRLNQLIQKEEPQVFILSPTGFTGVSIELENYFQRIFCDFSGNTCDPYQLTQALHRERNYSIPASIFVTNHKRENVKTNWHDIYKDVNERMGKLNSYSLLKLNEQGFWEINKNYEAWFIYRAQNQADINSIYKIGVAEWFKTYISPFCDIQACKDIPEHIKKAMLKRNRIIDKRKRTHRKERLVITKLVSEKEYNEIRNKEKSHIISLEELDKKEKYELATSFNIQQKQDVDSLYDLSLDTSYLLRISKRIKALSNPIESFLDEKKEWDTGVIKLRIQSNTLSGLVFSKILKLIGDKDFSNRDLKELFKHEFLDELSTVTGKNYHKIILDNLKTKSNYRKLLEIYGPFMEDVKRLFSEYRSDDEYIETLNNIPEFRNEYEKLQQKHSRLFEEALKAKENPFDVIYIQRRIEKKEKALKRKMLTVSDYVEKLLAYAEKLKDEILSTSPEEIAIRSYRKLETEIKTLVHSWVMKIKQSFIPAWTTLLSDFLGRYGIKLDRVGQTRSRGKLYRVDISRIKNLLPKNIVNMCNREYKDSSYKDRLHGDAFLHPEEIKEETLFRENLFYPDRE
ncbi:MAG: hypothetical protein KDK45_00270 [Leptospiraceae bacterium]|nr:hypothetical protein [Leptospiraceae bacterium]